MHSKWTIRMKLGEWSSAQPRGAWARTLRRESRRRKRLQISLPVHIRTIGGTLADQEDLGEVVDFNSYGIYFTTSKVHYAPGMKLIVTLPYGEKAPVQRKLAAAVVRVEHRWIGSRGIGVQLTGDAG